MTLAQKPTVPGRRETSRALRRDAMLDVAAEYFLAHGYAATTMSGIAAAIGGSKATLWNYFPSKEALFEAVLQKVTAAFKEQLGSLLDPCGDLERTIRSFCASFVGKVTQPRSIALHRLVHAESGRFPEVGRIYFEYAPGNVQRMLSAFIGSAMARGALREADPLTAARTLLSLCFSGCHQRLLLARQSEATPEEIAADADHAAAIFLRAYAV